MNYITKGELIQLLQENPLPDNAPVVFESRDVESCVTFRNEIIRVGYSKPRSGRPFVTLWGGLDNVLPH